MGASISRLCSKLTGYDGCQTTIDPDPPFRFLDLPAELRFMVYDLILPNDITSVDLHARVSHLNSRRRKRPSAGLISYIQSHDRSTQHADPRFKKAIRQVLAMMETSHTIHTELGSLLYSRLTFVAISVVVAARFMNVIHPLFRPVFQNLKIHDRPLGSRIQGKRRKTHSYDLSYKDFPICDRLSGKSLTEMLIPTPRAHLGNRKNSGSSQWC